MTLVDLTAPYISRWSEFQLKTEKVSMCLAKSDYTGLVYHMASDSMNGTYLDVPGHFVETDDGRRADTIPVQELYRRPATVIHLDHADCPGPVTAEHLSAAHGRGPCRDTLIVNALGSKSTFEVPERSVYLDHSAIDWIIDSGCRWLISDIYECRTLQGIFVKLFKAGIVTVCEPARLHLLTVAEVKVTILFPLWPDVTQVPCRVIAEW